MSEQIGPHELLKTILHGTAPPRPLFLPIIFSSAARIENLPLRTFLANPTKITQALRQVRAHLGSDGVTCYFDPYLEVEALGGILEWGSSEEPRVRLTFDPATGDLREGLGTMDELSTKGRIPVAIEVIRRLKSLVRNECLLTVGISGPFALAAQLMRAKPHATGDSEICSETVGVASEAIAPIAKAFVEAGANVVFIREELPPSAVSRADLSSLLATTINIVRFYEAIPVLLSCGSRHPSAAVQQSLNCVVCPVWSEIVLGTVEKLVRAAPANFGVAVPVSVIAGGQTGIDKFAVDFGQIVSTCRPALITTSDDVPNTADLRNLRKLLDFLIA
jgi:hypothetical protein